MVARIVSSSDAPPRTFFHQGQNQQVPNTPCSTMFQGRDLENVMENFFTFLAWLILQMLYRSTSNSGMALAQGGACLAIIQSCRCLCGRACSDQLVSKREPRSKSKPKASCSHICLVSEGSRDQSIGIACTLLDLTGPLCKASGVCVC